MFDARSFEFPLLRTVLTATKTLALLALLAGFWAVSCVLAAEPTARPIPGVDPPLPDGSVAAEQQIGGLRRPEKIGMRLFAAEPQLHSPVALSVDEQGRVFIAEEYRFNRGTEENRTRPFLLEDDLQISTVAERAAMLEKYADRFEGGLDWFYRFTDQVKLLEDKDGDGRADKATVFAGDFSGVTAGIASGVMATNGDVFVTCIPNLYRLRDTDGDGKSDEREVLLSGFGVNAGFLGHDLHGLTWGPDGRLYFTIGDRGFDVVDKEGKRHQLPRRGAVFRCEPDGSHFEVVHIGLRNPQELAFDHYGNLFADDNNCDKGDHSRLVYVVPGGDSGWSMPFQTILPPYETGPWHAEKIWAVDGEPEAEGVRPAWVLPPVGKLGAGPSGFAYNGSVGWREDLRNRFFMCNFAGGQGIESFRLATKGASFQIEDPQDFLKPMLASDLEFGYDGQMYVSDFIGLIWEGNTRGGRVYTLRDETAFNDPQVVEVKELFQKGFDKLPQEKLLKLLGHADQRVRQRAQFTLAAKGKAAITALTQVALSKQPVLSRLHATWGLGQIARANAETTGELEKTLKALLQDQEIELRAHAAKLAGEHKLATLEEPLLKAMQDEVPRVAFLTTLALAELQSKKAIEPALALAEANNDVDKYIRHAVVQLLKNANDQEAIHRAAKHASPAVRMVALLAMRQQKDPALATFLTDADVRLVTEAVRAIHDLQMDAQLSEVAALGTNLTVAGSEIPEALARRILHANFRLGEASNLQFMVRAVLTPHLPAAIRREALEEIGLWINPEKRDRVIGIWRPLEPRDPAMVRATLEPLLPSLLSVEDADLQTRIATLIVSLELKADTNLFAQWLGETDRPAATRAAALTLLAAKKVPELETFVSTSLSDKEPLVRQTATRILVSRDAKQGLTRLLRVLSAEEQAASTLAEKQEAIQLLASLDDPAADAPMVEWAERLARGTVPASLQLDVLEAAEKRKTPRLANPLAAYYQRLGQDGDKLTPYRIALEGGDAERGEQIFLGHRQAQCLRCHKVKDRGGDAGPNLTRVSATAERAHLLQSLILPSAKIAPGFGNITVVNDEGLTITGTLKNETPESVELVLVDGTKRVIAKEEILSRTEPVSAMPPMEKVLSLREMRDVLEFLSTLK